MKYEKNTAAAMVIAGILLTGTPVSAATTPAPKTTTAVTGRPKPTLNSNVRGTVTAVNGTTLSITTAATKTSPATVYTVDASNAKITKTGADEALSSIPVGDIIVVSGTVNGTSITATDILDGTTGGLIRGNINDGGHGTGVVGVVSAISGDSITLTSKGDVFATKGPKAKTNAITYTVSAEKAKIMKSGKTASISSIAVGDSIVVTGGVTGTTITATMIQDGLSTPGKAELQTGSGEELVTGIAKSVSGTTIAFTDRRGTAYTVDASQANFSKPGTPGATMGSIASGDMLTIQGTVSGSTITARTVIDKAFTKSTGGIKGVVNAIGNFFSQHSTPKFPF